MDVPALLPSDMEVTVRVGASNVGRTVGISMVLLLERFVGAGRKNDFDNGDLGVPDEGEASCSARS